MKKLLAVLLLLALLAPTCTAFADTATYPSTQAFLNALDQEGVLYKNCGIDDDGDEYILLEFSDQDHEYSINFFFHDDQEHASVFVWYIIYIDEEDALEAMLACNTLNSKYNYTCFYLDETDYTVTASMNLIFRDSNVDQVAMDALMYMQAIMENAYPVLQPYQK